VDAVLGGTLSQLVQDRMFGSRLGEIFILPTPRQRSLSDMIVFAGLGPLEAFRPQILELVAENIARVATTARLTNLAAVPIGTNAGLSVEQSVDSFSKGFLRGLKRGDPDHEFQGIQVCELDPKRFALLREGLEQKVASGFYRERNVEIDLRLGKVAGGPNVDVARQVRRDETPDPLYLQVSCSRDPVAACSRLEYSVLAADQPAAIERHGQLLTVEKQNEAGRRLAESKRIDAALGQALTDYYLPPSTRNLMVDYLDQEPNRHVVVIHDGGASVVPWEVLHFGKHCPAITAGMSRKYVLPTSRAGGRSNLPPETHLKMLLIFNPTNDLDGAEDEGKEMEALFRERNGTVTVLRNAEATKQRILAELKSNEYDILHYAGHADFVEDQPGDSGVLCADGRLTSADFTEAVFAPQLVFLNGCESGRVRERRGKPSATTIRDKLFEGLKEQVSLAEMILTGGVRNFVGTYWPVNDKAATRFSATFYERLLQGEALGIALRDARQAIRPINDRDWANYLHFGNPNYRIRRPVPVA
jgi:hypothetical protein